MIENAQRQQEPQINFRKRDISSSELPLQLKVFKSQTFGHNRFASGVQLIPYQYIILSIKQNQFIRADNNSLHRLSVSTPKNAFIMVPTIKAPYFSQDKNFSQVFFMTKTEKKRSKYINYSL